MKIRRIEDIEKEKHDEDRANVRNEISEDINEVIGNIFGKPKKRKRGFLGWAWFFIKIIAIIILIIIIADIILGSIWLLKFLIQNLF